MSTVTADAGLSIGIVNFHFKSKQNLLEETLVFLAREHHAHWLKAYEDAGLSPQDKLLAIVDSHFHPKICTRKKLAVWFAFFGEGKRRAIYRSLIDEIDEQRFKLSTELLSEIAGKGQYTGPPPHHISCALQGLYDGLWLNILMYPNEFDRQGSKAQVHAYLASVFPRHFTQPAF